MPAFLTADEERCFLDRGFSRRHFGRIAMLGAGAAALPFFNEAAMAQLSSLRGVIPPDAVARATP